jgi:hypothetical protein
VLLLEGGAVALDRVNLDFLGFFDLFGVVGLAITEFVACGEDLLEFLLDSLGFVAVSIGLGASFLLALLFDAVFGSIDVDEDLYFRCFY